MFALFGSFAILFLSVSIVGGSNDSKEHKIQLSHNATSYRWIDRLVNRYLLNETYKDSSPVYMLLNPKADQRIIARVVRAYARRKPIILQREEEDVTLMAKRDIDDHSRVLRIVGIFANIEDVRPLEWKRIYGEIWNSRANIAIWLTDVTNHSETSLERDRLVRVLETFWSIDCLNVALVVMVRRTDRNDIVPRLYGYEPFAKGEKISTRVALSPGQMLFPDKFKNLNGHPIAISIFQKEPHSRLLNYTKLGSGATVDYLRYLSSWLNFTIDIKSAPIPASSYMVSLPDGTTVSRIGDILTNRSVYLANTERLDVGIGRKLDYLRPFDEICLQVLVPRSGPMPGIIRLFRSIDYSIAVLMSVSFVFLVGYSIVRGKNDPIMRILRLLLHQQLSEISVTWSERIFSIASIFWAFFVCTAIQSNLIKDLTDSPFYKNIDSVEELASSSLILETDSGHLEDLVKSDSVTNKALAVNARIEEDFLQCAKELMARGNVACVIDDTFIEDVAYKINRNSAGCAKSKLAKPKVKNDCDGSHGGAEAVHIVRECITEYWRTNYAKEGFPYLDKFNAGRARTVEFGLLAKWKRDSVVSHLSKKMVKESIHTYSKLNMSHFDGAFKILMIGNGIASVMLLGEFIFYHLKRLFLARANARRTL